MSDGWPFYEDLGVLGAFHHLGWLLCWGEPMAPLLGWTNGFAGAPASRARPLRGALGQAPPPVCRVEMLKKFTGKSVPENYILFFVKNMFFPSQRSETYLERQISSRQSGRNFFIQNWLENVRVMTFFQPFILCGFCLYFNFWSCPP